MTRIFTVSLLVCAIFCTEEKFSYTQSGSDWSVASPNCGGSSQSPINIQTSTTVSVGPSKNLTLYPAFNSKAISYSTGDAIVSTGTWDYIVSLDSLGNLVNWNEANVHVHAPSEHTINGVQGDAEIHFVHKIASPTNSTYQIIVLSMIFKQTAGVASNFISQWNFMSNATRNNINWTAAVTPEMQTAQGYYTYSGSLTTPPCTETVKWIVLDKMQDLSSAQLDAINGYFKNNKAFANGRGNNRATQPLNGRTVQYYSFATPLIGAAVNIAEVAFVGRIWSVLAVVMWALITGF